MPGSLRIPQNQPGNLAMRYRGLTPSPISKKNQNKNCDLFATIQRLRGRFAMEQEQIVDAMVDRGRRVMSEAMDWVRNESGRDDSIVATA